MRLVGSWGVAHNEFKGGFGGGGIRPGVVYILGEWEPSVPSGLAVVDKDAKVLFEPLICSFGLAVSLGVIGGAYVLFDIEEATKFLQEMGCEAGVSVCDDLAGSAVVWEDVLDIKVSDGGGRGRFVTGDKNSSFRAVVIGDGEDAVEAIGEGEFNDKVHGNGFKGEGGAVGRDGAVRDAGARGIDFGGLASGATTDEGSDKGLHVGPPVILGDEEAGLEDAGVTCSGGIVVQGGHSPPKGVVCHDDEAGAIPPRAVRVLLQRVGIGPLGKEGGMGGLGSEKGSVKISGGHGAKKQGVRQGEDTVVIMDSSVMIWAAREGIGVV